MTGPFVEDWEDPEGVTADWGHALVQVVDDTAVLALVDAETGREAVARLQVAELVALGTAIAAAREDLEYAQQMREQDAQQWRQAAQRLQQSKTNPVQDRRCQQ